MNQENINIEPNISTPTSSETISPVETKAKKSVGKIILISVIGFFILVGALIGLIILITNSTTKAPLQVSDNFLMAFSETNSQNAYSLTSSEFRDAVDKESFDEYFNMYGELISSEAKVVGKSIETTTSGTIATINYLITYNSEKYSIQTEVIKEGDSWKILSIEIN